MVGTESDKESFKYAVTNVERNNLQDLIECQNQIFFKCLKQFSYQHCNTETRS